MVFSLISNYSKLNYRRRSASAPDFGNEVIKMTQDITSKEKLARFNLNNAITYINSNFPIRITGIKLTRMNYSKLGIKSASPVPNYTFEFAVDTFSKDRKTVINRSVYSDILSLSLLDHNQDGYLTHYLMKSIAINLGDFPEQNKEIANKLIEDAERTERVINMFMHHQR